MGLFNFWGKSNVSVERDRNGNYRYEWLDQEGFINSEKYLELSLSNPVLLAIIALRSKIYSQMKISHLNSAGEPIKNSPVLQLFKQPNYFQSQEDFLFQQMWFLSANGTNLTYKVDAGSVTKAIYNLIPSEIDLNDTHKVIEGSAVVKGSNEFTPVMEIEIEKQAEQSLEIPEPTIEVTQNTEIEKQLLQNLLNKF